MHLPALFNTSFDLRRDEVALEWEGRLFTFGEIHTRSARMAQVLRAKGVKSGDRLALYLANRVEYIDLYLACVRLGVMVVPINILYRDREIAHIWRDAEPVAIVAAEPVGELHTWLVDDLAREAAAQTEEAPVVVTSGDTPAAIVYTSGTTGTSKGAVLTHHNFAVNATNLLTCWQITAADRLLLTLPLFHVHGLGNGLHCWLVSGCRMRLTERFDHQQVAAWFREFRPTVFFGVPTMYVRLLELDEAMAREIGAMMRLFVCGSAPLPAQTL